MKFLLSLSSATVVGAVVWFVVLMLVNLFYFTTFGTFRPFEFGPLQTLAAAAGFFAFGTTLHDALTRP